MTSYAVDYAKTGRSKCKESGELIPKDEMRIAKVTEVSRQGETMMMTAWHRAVPFFQMMQRMRKKENQLMDVGDMAGFQDLREEDQERLRKMLSDFHDADVDFPPPKEKKRKNEEGEGEAEAAPTKKKSLTVKATELPQVDEEIRSNIKAADLKALANELVERCRQRGLNVPTDDAVARQRVGSLILEVKKSDKVDVAAVIRAADVQFGVKKAVETASPENADLAAAFNELASAYFKAGDRMRGAAYKKATATIADQPDPITSGKACKSLPGIGKASVEKIDEFLQTGRIAKLEELQNA